jgi:hypothetical protein
MGSALAPNKGKEK